MRQRASLGDRAIFCRSICIEGACSTHIWERVTSSLVSQWRAHRLCLSITCQRRTQRSLGQQRTLPLDFFASASLSRNRHANRIFPAKRRPRSRLANRLGLFGNPLLIFFLFSAAYAATGTARRVLTITGSPRIAQTLTAHLRASACAANSSRKKRKPVRIGTAAT